MDAIQYKTSVGYIPSSGNITTLATATETTAIDYHESNDTGSVRYLPVLQGNSQASLRFNVANLGSLTEVDVRIYWYTKLSGTDTTFQKTSGAVSSGVETVSLHNLKVTATGTYDYDFPIMACDGIKVTFQGVGTPTGSSITNIHLLCRTN